MANTKKNPKQKIVIVGGGFGGIKAALALCNEDFAEVTLVSERSDFYYYPTMYLTATGRSERISAIPLERIFENKKITIVEAKATKVDQAAKNVILETKEAIAYDKLILALGVVTNYFGIPGLEEHSYGIKSIPEITRFKRHLHAQLIAENKPDLRYVVVGGGPTGIELAGDLGAYLKECMKRHNIRRRAVHIDLVEAMPHLMPRLPRPVGRGIERRLRKLGVKLYMGSRVEGASSEELTVSGKPIRSHTIIWTAGVANNPFFTDAEFKLSPRRKVLVDEFLRAEGSKDVFVIGDNAETPFSGMAQTALRDAEFVAHNLLLESRGDPKLAYRAKEPVYITPVGPYWASVLWGDVHLRGVIGWLLRGAADFRAFTEFESLPRAVEQLSYASEHQDLCPVCGSQQ
ncbi:MAG: FAD-dependent oxidoreductase [Candidatus Saccharimonadales bacterium]